MIPLRRFLYLDTSAVDDYLSALEGGVIEGSVDARESTKGDKAAGLGVRGLEARVSGGRSQEERISRRITPEAKFQRLYSLLHKREAIQPLDAFDPLLVAELERREVVEIEAALSVPELHGMLEAADELTQWLPLLELAGGLSEDDRLTAKQIRSLASLVDNEPVPLAFSAHSTPEARFAAQLSREFLRRPLHELSGEATVLATVQRVIPDGSTHELWNMLGAVAAVEGFGINRSQRRALNKKQEKGAVPEEMRVTIPGPAALVTVVAIYR